MAVLVRIEIETALRDFLEGDLTPEQFEAWIVSAIEDSSIPEDRDALWEIRLFLTEFGEDLRPIEDARGRAAALLADVVTPQRTDSESTTTTIPVSSAA
jgi:hypothetical protein